MRKKTKFKTAEEITAAFIKRGWKDNTSFTEVQENGKKLFRMNETGNLFDENGDIYRYNIPTCIKRVV